MAVTVLDLITGAVRPLSLLTGIAANIMTFEMQAGGTRSLAAIIAQPDTLKLFDMTSKASLTYNQALVADGGSTNQFSPNSFAGATQTARIRNAMMAMAVMSAAGVPTQLNLGIDTVSQPNTNVWKITEAITPGDQMTVRVDAATVKKADGTFDNLFRNAGIVPDPANPNGKCLSAAKNTGIKIIGVNGAKLEGANVPFSAPRPDTGGASVPWVGDDFGWRGCLITMANVEGLQISGFRTDKPTVWAITLSHGCNNFAISAMNLNSLNVLNGDGIDLRNGCTNGTVTGIVGDTSDDIVAVCAAVPFADGTPYPMIPLGYEPNALGDDTHHITIDGVTGQSGAGNLVRAFTTGANGTSLHHITIRNINQTGGARCINIGTFGAYSPAPTALNNFLVENVVAQTANAVTFSARISDSTFTNIEAKAAGKVPIDWNDFNRTGSTNVTFTTGTIKFPAVLLDPVLTTGPGSLLLADMSHPNNPIAVSATVADNMVIPNIAYQQMVTLAGGSNYADWTARAGTGMVVTGGTPEGKFEKSGKGGIHVIVSRTADVSGRGFFVGERSKSTKLTQYLLVNPNNKIGVWIWERCTQVGLTATPEPVSSILYANNGGTNDIAWRVDRVASTGPSAVSSADPALPQPTGNRRRAVATTGYSGAAPTTDLNVHLLAWVIGNQIEGATTLHKSRSAILYRIYIEDLTVSGRTFAQVDALDAAQWAAAIGTGGRYEAATETFTDPATVV
jgi:hypothetical protein